MAAEGIERAAKLSLVRALGCYHGQGYYFSHPIPVEAMTALLAGEAIVTAGQIVGVA